MTVYWPVKVKCSDCGWKFKKPNAVTEAQFIEAFNETAGFVGWIERKGGKPQITGWW